MSCCAWSRNVKRNSCNLFHFNLIRNGKRKTGKKEEWWYYNHRENSSDRHVTLISTFNSFNETFNKLLHLMIASLQCCDFLFVLPLVRPSTLLWRVETEGRATEERKNKAKLRHVAFDISEDKLPDKNFLIVTLYDVTLINENGMNIIVHRKSN